MIGFIIQNHSSKEASVIVYNCLNWQRQGKLWQKNLVQILSLQEKYQGEIGKPSASCGQAPGEMLISRSTARWERGPKSSQS